MTISYTPRAKADLDRILDYYNALDPAIFPKILREILDTLNDLERHPWLGREQRTKRVRRIVAQKYGYLIYFRYRERQHLIEVLRVVHGRMRRPYKDR